MFVLPEDRAGEAYRALWDGLRQGRFSTAEFRRIAKGERVVWLQASYNPILDLRGKPVKVVKEPLSRFVL
jgi:methyl-accepting chemotaxis protein